MIQTNIFLLVLIFLTTNVSSHVVFTNAPYYEHVYESLSYPSILYKKVHDANLGNAYEVTEGLKENTENMQENASDVAKLHKRSFKYNISASPKNAKACPQGYTSDAGKCKKIFQTGNLSILDIYLILAKAHQN